MNSAVVGPLVNSASILLTDHLELQGEPFRLINLLGLQKRIAL